MRRSILIVLFLCAVVGGGTAQGAPRWSTAWPGEIQWPKLVTSGAAPAFANNLTINDANDNGCLVFQVPKTGYITHLGFRVTTVTDADDIAVILETVNNKLYRSGTRLHTNDTGVVNVATANKYYWVSLDSLGDSASVTQGQLVAMTVRKNATSAGTINITVPSSIQSLDFATGFPRHYDSVVSISLRSTTGAFFSTYAIKMSGVGVPIGTLPAESLDVKHVYDSASPHASNPDEVGLYFKPKFPCIVAGVVPSIVGSVSGTAASGVFPDARIAFYNGTTLYDSITIEAVGLPAASGGSQTGKQWYFSKPCTLLVGGTYRFTVKPTGNRDATIDTGLAIYYMTVSDSATWYCTKAGPELHWTQRADGGAFTEYWNRRPFMDLLIVGLSASRPTLLPATGVGQWFIDEAEKNFAGDWHKIRK